MSRLPAGYVVTVACATCGPLRFDRDEDPPLDVRAIAFIRKRHDCATFDKARAEKVLEVLCAVVARGKRPTMSVAISLVARGGAA